MIAPLAIHSLSQGLIRRPPPSDEAHWEAHQEDLFIEDLPFWHAMKVEWPRWSLRRRADQR
jgi:hypothetical protein